MRLIDVETINGTFILNEQYSGREIMALLNQQPTAYDLKETLARLDDILRDEVNQDVADDVAIAVLSGNTIW